MILKEEKLKFSRLHGTSFSHNEYPNLGKVRRTYGCPNSTEQEEYLKAAQLQIKAFLPSLLDVYHHQIIDEYSKL